MKPKFIYNLPVFNNFSLDKTIFCHGWVFLAPFKYDPETKELSLTLEADGICFTVGVQQEDETVFVRSGEELTEDSIIQLKRVLGADESTLPLLKMSKRLSKEAHSLVNAGYGRMLRAPTLWEDLAKTLLTTNCNWRKTQSMVSNLCNAFGVQANGCKSFPTPVSIIDAPDEKIKNCGLGYRLAYLKALAVMCINGDLDGCENEDVSTDRKAEILGNIKGFGPYSVSHALVLLQDYSRIPIDSDSTGYLNSLGFSGKAIQDAYASWGKYRFWGYKLDRIARKLNWIGD